MLHIYPYVIKSNVSENLAKAGVGKADYRASESLAVFYTFLQFVHKQPLIIVFYTHIITHERHFFNCFLRFSLILRVFLLKYGQNPQNMLKLTEKENAVFVLMDRGIMKGAFL